MITIDSEDTAMDYEALYHDLQEKYEELEMKYTTLLQEYESLKQNKSKAGRRPNDEKWTAKLKAFAAMKDAGAKREEIQDKLGMSRATYFRFNKIYSEGQLNHETKQVSGSDALQVSAEVLVKAEVALKEHSEGLVLDSETGQYVTPEGLKRRRKLAEIRARRAAEEEQKRLSAELEKQELNQEKMDDASGVQE